MTSMRNDINIDIKKMIQACNRQVDAYLAYSNEKNLIRKQLFKTILDKRDKEMKDMAKTYYIKYKKYGKNTNTR